MQCQAGYGERTEERTNSRDGYRGRRWETRAGTIDLKVPDSCVRAPTSRRGCWCIAVGPSRRWRRSSLRLTSNGLHQAGGGCGGGDGDRRHLSVPTLSQRVRQQRQGARFPFGVAHEQVDEPGPERRQVWRAGSSMAARNSGSPRFFRRNRPRSRTQAKPGYADGSPTRSARHTTMSGAMSAGRDRAAKNCACSVASWHSVTASSH